MRDAPTPEQRKAERTKIEAERALAGGPLDVPSAAELDRLLPKILDATLGEGVPEARKPAFANRLPIFGIPALAAAAAVIFMVTRPDDGFKARGDHLPMTLSMELFCVPPGGSPRPIGDVTTPSECPRGATLVVALPSSAAGEPVSVRFVDADGARIDKGTVPAPASGPVPLPLVLDDVALGVGTVSVAVGEEQRTVRVHVVGP